MNNLLENIRDIWERTDVRAIIYGAFSNWGLVVLANIIGLFFINIIGIDLVRKFTPFAYLLLGILFYFPCPRSRDFRIGYILAFIIGLIFLTLFYYPLLIA